MADYLPDTPQMARVYCPTCEPEADPEKEILEVRWCEGHKPSDVGEDDGVVRAAGVLSGSSEAGGEDNRRVCDLIHRNRG